MEDFPNVSAILHFSVFYSYRPPFSLFVVAMFVSLLNKFLKVWSLFSIIINQKNEFHSKYLFCVVAYKQI